MDRTPIGPHVIQNMNRCIHCTRCIRFTDEITGTSELGFFKREQRARIRRLDDSDERVGEIARMLGGEKVAASAVAHARELLSASAKS
jgi:NADH dehydrogenase/NADH:ubiquinone oxidoreductase subunit G